MSGEKLTDEELLRRVIDADDKAAWQVLWMRHSERSLAICRRYCAPEAEALNGDVWAKILERCHTFRADGKFVAWLVVISTSVCLDHLRKIKRRIKEVPVEGREGETGEAFIDRLAHPAEQAYQRAGDAEKIRAAFDRLETDEKRLLHRRFICGELVKDLARELSVSGVTVRKHIAQARAKLRQYLREEGITIADDDDDAKGRERAEGSSGDDYDEGR